MASRLRRALPEVPRGKTLCGDLLPGTFAEAIAPAFHSCRWPSCLVGSTPSMRERMHAGLVGGGVIVGPGVTIGTNTVVGAGAVVVCDLPANVVAVGNPARVNRTFED